MTDGLVTELPELIALRRYARTPRYRPDRHMARAGNHVSKLRGRGMDFAEVRNYQAGDEIRHMEWRVTARTGRPHIKLYQEELERPAMLLIDFNPSMYFGTRLAFKSVVAARLAALIAWTAVTQSDRVGGLVFSAGKHNEFTPRGRERGILPLLAALSQYTQETRVNGLDSEAQPRPLSDALLRLQRVCRPGSILVVISDFYQFDEESLRHLSRLRAHNDILAYHICDPLELAPPKPQQYGITDGKQELVLDTSAATIATAYQRYCEERINALQSRMQRLQIQTVSVTATDDLSLLVRQTYPRRSHA